MRPSTAFSGSKSSSKCHMSSARWARLSCTTSSASLMSLLSAVAAPDFRKIRSVLLPPGLISVLYVQVVMYRNGVVEVFLHYLKFENGVPCSMSSNQCETVNSTCTQERRLRAAKEKVLQDADWLRPILV